MSTASGNPPHLVQLSDDCARLVPEPEPGEPHGQIEAGKEDSPRSPYAPKPAHERAAARLHVLDKEEDKISPYAPWRRRSPVPSAPSSSEGGQQDGEIRRSIMADRDLEQIEASLRLLQLRQAAALQLPRGPNLPPPPEPLLAPPGASAGARRERSRLLTELPSPPSLEPTRLSPPSLRPTLNLHAIFGVSIVCIAAAVACYWFVDGPVSRPAVPTQVALTTPSPSRINELKLPQPSQVESNSVESDSKADWWHARATGSAKDHSEIGKQPEPSTPPLAMIPQPPATGARADVAPPSAKQAARALRPEEIELLIQQGEKFMAAGDIVTARMIFHRAAQSEDATAALALAAAYDPLVLSKLGVLGVDSSPEKARSWYAKAQSLGSSQAVARLKALDNR